MSRGFDREEMSTKYQDRIGSMPERVLLDIKIIYKRRMVG